jgi:hypothetical protein
MRLKTNNDLFAMSIISALEAMSEVTSNLLEDKTITLTKNGILFGIIAGGELYFRSNEIQAIQTFNGIRYAKSQKLPVDRDDFLIAATQAYWIARGKDKA